MKTNTRPPQLWERFFRWFCHPDFYEELEGDLLEHFYENLEEQGLFFAQKAYRKDVLMLFRPSVIKQLQFTFLHQISPDMLKNYFKSAWRSLFANRFTSLLNVLGLSLGLACFMFILLYVWDETHFDNFHQKGEAIYRVNRINAETGEGGTVTSYPFMQALQASFPQIAQMVRLGGDGIVVYTDDEYFVEEGFYWSDSTFFEVFSFPLLQGSAATVLHEPNALVLTERMAKKYFGVQDPIGQSLIIKIRDAGQKINFKVSGVVADPPANSHIQFNFLAPISKSLQVYPQFVNWWTLNWLHTYALVPDATAVAAIEDRIPALLKKHLGEKAPKNLTLEFQPLSAVYLHSDHLSGRQLKGSQRNVFLFSSIALFILLIACINFINLATARSGKRSKEVGVRKVLGARRGQLIAQFLTESFLITAISLTVALMAVRILLPFFNVLASKSLTFETFAQSGFWWILSALLVLVAIVAGLYPAFYLSRFKPVKAIKGIHKTGRLQNISLRQALVVLQFVISVFLIIGTLTIQRQLKYAHRSSLGFDKAHLLAIPVEDQEAISKIGLLKEEFGRGKGVAEVTMSGENLPSKMNNNWNIEWTGLSPERREVANVVAIDADYFEVLGIPFLEGENLRHSQRPDSSKIIVNQAVLDMIGWKKGLNRELTIGDIKGNIVGVVDNFHYTSFHQDIEPTVYFSRSPGFFSSPDNLILRIDGHQVKAALEDLEQRWDAFGFEQSFSYAFVEDAFNALYESENRFFTLFQIFAFLAIFISCLGLIGLSTFTLEQRTKEIGIRKILGASVLDLSFMVSKSFLALVLIANVIAIPLAYLVMGRWLENFSYHTNLAASLAFTALLISILITLLSLAYQVFKHTLENPVEALRYE